MAEPGSATLTSTWAFGGEVTLGSSVGPIQSLEGGVLTVEPIVKGHLNGPEFNCTIEGGMAIPMRIPDETGSGTKAQLPFIYLYGHADDGSPFYIEEVGNGTFQAQSTRMIIRVGGKYAGLQNKFLIAQPVPNYETKVVSVQCFSVPLPA